MRAAAADIASTGFAPFAPSTFAPPKTLPNFFQAMWTFYTNPVKIWPEALYHEPMIQRRMLGRQVIDLADPALIRKVLLDDQASYGRSDLANPVLREGVGDGLLTTEGEIWRRQRRIASPSFRHMEITPFAQEMGEAGDRAAARLLDLSAREGDRIIDVAPEMITATLDIILDTVLGGAELDVDRPEIARNIGIFLDNMGRLDPFDVLGGPSWAPRPWKWRGQAATARFRAIARSAITQMRARLDAGQSAQNGRKLGLTEQLILAADPEQGGGLTDQEVLDNVLTFVGAGHETTALTLSWTLYLLAQAPELQEALAEEAIAAVGDGPITAEALEATPLGKQVIKESLRLYPPAAGVARSVRQPTELGGFALEPGDHVTIAIYPMHRHHRLWREPAMFDPARFADDQPQPDRFAYMPFGGGPTICIGMAFALLEASALLTALLRKVRVAPGAPGPIEPVLRVTLRPEGGMPLRVTAR